MSVDPDCRLFCFGCGRDLGEKSPAIEAVVLCEDCSKDDDRPKPAAMSLVEYQFAIEKELAEKYVWTSKMLARHASNIGTYAEACALLHRQPGARLHVAVRRFRRIGGPCRNRDRQGVGWRGEVGRGAGIDGDAAGGDAPNCWSQAQARS